MDYSHFNQNDINSFIKESYVLHALEDDIHVQLLTLRYNENCAIISSPFISKETIVDTSKTIQGIYNKIGKLTAPWVDVWYNQQEEKKTLNAADINEIKSRWEAVFGSIDSPEMQAKLEKLKENVKKAREGKS